MSICYIGTILFCILTNELNFIDGLIYTTCNSPWEAKDLYTLTYIFSPVSEYTDLNYILNFTPSFRELTLLLRVRIMPLVIDVWIV